MLILHWCNAGLILRTLAQQWTSMRWVCVSDGRSPIPCSTLIIPQTSPTHATIPLWIPNDPCMAVARLHAPSPPASPRMDGRPKLSQLFQSKCSMKLGPWLSHSRSADKTAGDILNGGVGCGDRHWCHLSKTSAVHFRQGMFYFVSVRNLPGAFFRVSLPNNSDVVSLQ